MQRGSSFLVAFFKATFVLALGASCVWAGLQLGAQ